MGRFGPFVQIGTKDDEEKPKFAGLRPGQKMDKITLADAMELFKLPRTLGETADGETIVANVGRFGPYVKYGAKYVSLKEDDPYKVTLERALEVIRLKQEADANRLISDFPDDGIQVLNGRYGPYITDKKKNAKIPKDRDPKSITLEEAIAMIAAAPGARWPLRPLGARQEAGAAAGANGAAAAPKAQGQGQARARWPRRSPQTRSARRSRPRRLPSAPRKPRRPRRPPAHAEVARPRHGRRASRAPTAKSASAKTRRREAAGRGGGQRPRAAREVGARAPLLPARVGR